MGDLQLDPDPDRGDLGAGAQRLSTRLVAAGLLAAALCLGVGMGMILIRGEEASTAAVQVVQPSQVLERIGDSRTWLTLGVLCLLATPSLRVLGLLRWCQVEGKRLALGAGCFVLLLLLGALGRATWLAEQAA